MKKKQQKQLPQSKGKKNDELKPTLAFVSTHAMWEMGKALSFGAKKYDKWNYKNGIEVVRTLSASLRHIYQFLNGEDVDPETGSLHLGNAMAGLSMAIDTYYNHPELDDRFKKNEQIIQKTNSKRRLRISDKKDKKKTSKPKSKKRKNRS